MDNLRYCEKCDKLFAYLGNSLCPACYDEQEQIFEKVRNYIKKYQEATIIEIGEALDIDEYVILKFVREGRLVSKGLKEFSTWSCESCGTAISSGRYCQKCTSGLKKELNTYITPKQAPRNDSFNVKKSDKDNRWRSSN